MIAPSDLGRLFRLPICALSALAAANGYIACARAARPALVVVGLAVFLLACAGSAYNQVQERARDALMARTRARPVAAGALSPTAAACIAPLLGTAGIALLYASGGAWAALLGALTLALYNGVYTPLKRVTAFAILPGALVGAAIPAIGWVSAGGAPADGRLLAISFFWFMWQVPHFSLLLMHGAGEHERAGFPTLYRRLSAYALPRATFAWIVGTASSALLLGVFGASPAAWAGLVLAMLGAGLCTFAWLWLSRGKYAATFRAVNVYALAVTVVCLIEAL